MRKKIVDFAILRLVLAVCAFLVGAAFCGGPFAWHSGSSFYYVNILGKFFSIGGVEIAWPLCGAALIAAGFCLLSARFRPIGYLIGGIIYSFFTLAVWLTWPTGHSGSVLAPCDLTTVAALYWTALRWSLYEQFAPGREELS